MNVALVHDYLNQWGGGERVLETIAGMFPEAPIYTLLRDIETTRGRLKGHKIYTSILDNPLTRRGHRWFIPLMPVAAELMRLRGYDLVISTSSGFAKGVCVPKDTPHISYIHSPLRYAWDSGYITDELRYAAPFSYFPPAFFSAITAPIAAYLRAWDRRASKKPNMLLANSGYIARLIERYYGRKAIVLYPPVDTHFFSYASEVKRKYYFLAVGRLVSYKRFDLLIDTFNASGLPLKIVGVGRDEARLRARVKSPHIEFLGSVYDEELRTLYREAIALLFPQTEDFGLAAAESIACGTPVIAYAEGGALEIVEDRKSGILFREQTPESLAAAIADVKSIRWDHGAIAASAQRFSIEQFEFGMRSVIASFGVK